MGEHVPFITDPRHLEAVAGSRYLVLRPPDAVREAYGAVQERIMARGLGDGVSYPAAHLTLKGFGVETDDVISEVVAAWARSTSPLPVAPLRVSSFPEVRVLIVEVGRDDALVAATRRIRDAASNLPAGSEDQIPVEDWVFHLSLAYGDWLEATAWDALDAWARRIPVERVMGTCLEAELLAFDGGPERLIRRFPLAGENS